VRALLTDVAIQHIPFYFCLLNTLSFARLSCQIGWSLFGDGDNGCMMVNVWDVEADSVYKGLWPLSVKLLLMTSTTNLIQ